MPRAGGGAAAPHSGPARAPSASADADFHAWWAALTAAERRRVLHGLDKRPRASTLGGACGACVECTGAEAAAFAAPTAQLLEDMAASPAALAAWRDAHAAPAQRCDGACGGGGTFQKRGAVRSCTLWSGAPVAAPALAAFAAAAPPSLLEWRVPEFAAALDTYLSDRLLCKDCRLNVARAFRELQDALSRRAGCGCSPAFCTALLESGQPWWPAATYTLTEERLLADWPAAFGPADDVARFEWSIGSDAGLDDTHAWCATPDGGPHIDAAVRLDGGAAHYVNLRAVFGAGRPAEVVSSRAQPMFGEACAHRRFVLRGEGGGSSLTLTLTRAEGPEGLRDFFEHAEQLQAEDAAEAEAASAEYDLPGSGGSSGGGDGVGALDGERGDDVAHDSHVDTPELAAEALLDAACVLLKTRVERAHARHAAGRHVAALAAGALADGVEAALRTAHAEVAVAARQAALLAELEAEAAAAKAAPPSSSKKKSSKKAKATAAAATAPQPQQEEQQQCDARQPEQLAAALAALALPASPAPPRQPDAPADAPATPCAASPSPPPSEAEAEAELTVGTPPKNGSVWQQPAAAATPAAAAAAAAAATTTAAAVTEAVTEAAAWSVQGRRRRRLSSTHGSRDSLVSSAEGDAMDGMDFPVLRAPPQPPQPQQQRVPPPPPPQQQPQQRQQRQQQRAPPPPPPPPPQPVLLRPLAPVMFYAPPPPMTQPVPPFAMHVAYSAGASPPYAPSGYQQLPPSPLQQQHAWPASPQPQPPSPPQLAAAAAAGSASPGTPQMVRRTSGGAAAFYEGSPGGFGLFQLPIGGAGAGGFASMFQ